MDSPSDHTETGGGSRVPEWLKNVGIVMLALVLLGIFVWRPKALVGNSPPRPTPRPSW